MENRTTTNTFLKYVNPHTKEQKLVSIESILDVGVPIITEGDGEGDELELSTNELCDAWGDPV